MCALSVAQASSDNLPLQRLRRRAAGLHRGVAVGVLDLPAVIPAKSATSRIGTRAWSIQVITVCPIVWGVTSVRPARSQALAQPCLIESTCLPARSITYANGAVAFAATRMECSSR